MLISVSRAVFYSHVSLGRVTSPTCFSPHIREFVSWRFISAPAPSLLLFYCISTDLKSIAAAFYALYFLHTRHSLSLSVFLFLSLVLGINSPSIEIQCRNKFHVWQKNCIIFLLSPRVLNINGLLNERSNPGFKT